MVDKVQKPEISLNKLSILKQTRSFLENILESSMDGIVLTDSKGYILKVNKHFRELLGCKQDEVIGEHISKFGAKENTTYTSTTGETVHIDKKFFEDTMKMYEGFVEENKTINRQSYFVSKNNRLIPVEQSMGFFHDGKGNVVGSLAIIRDITERLQAEQQLIASRDYLENVFTTSVDGLIITDSKGRITAVNKAAERIFGCSSDHIVGKHFNEMRFDRERLKVEGAELMAELMNNGTISGVERTWKKADGFAVDVEMNIALLKDDEGSLTGSVASIRDITEQITARKKLRESEEKYHNLIENAHDAIISMTMEGEIVSINKSAEEMFGYSREEIVGKPAYLLVAEPHREKQKDVKSEINKVGIKSFFDDKIIEGNGLKKNGKKFPVEVSYFIYEVQGEKIITGIIRNISKRKEEEQKLVNYQKRLKFLTSELILSEQKERQRFADFLHDEVGQQLFATRLQLEQLKNSLSSAENTKTLDTALNNLYQVMNQTRSLTTELSSPILKQLGLEKALEWLAEQTYKKYGVKVIFKDDKQEKPLDDNTKILLYQSVSELLANVVKHARTKSASVSINGGASKVEICVADNGVGFLVPGKGTYSTKMGGVGLFRMQERLEPLGGQMEIESQPDKGTRITLSVPTSNTSSTTKS